MATSPSNATTQEYTQGVNEIGQNDLNKDVSKGTSNKKPPMSKTHQALQAKLRKRALAEGKMVFTNNPDDLDTFSDRPVKIILADDIPPRSCPTYDLLKHHTVAVGKYGMVHVNYDLSRLEKMRDHYVYQAQAHALREGLHPDSHIKELLTLFDDMTNHVVAQGKTTNLGKEVQAVSQWANNEEGWKHTQDMLTSFILYMVKKDPTNKLYQYMGTNHEYLATGMRK